MKNTLVTSLNMVFCLTLPATAGLILLSEPIIRLIFEHGAFTPSDTLATAGTLSFYAIGLFAYSSNKVLVPAFYALDKTRYPVIASFLAILCNIAIINLTIDRFQHLAIAFSTSCTMLLNFVFLTTVLYFKMEGFAIRPLMRTFAKILTATAIMSCLLFWGSRFSNAWLTGTLFEQLVANVLLILSATLLYVFVLSFFKVQELTDIITKFRDRLGR